MIHIPEATRELFRVRANAALESGMLSNGGSTAFCEHEWGNLHSFTKLDGTRVDETNRAIATSSGTTGLELAVRALTPEGPKPGACVLIPAVAPPMLFWAVQRTGFEPVMVDCGLHGVPTHLEVREAGDRLLYDGKHAVAYIHSHNGGYADRSFFSLVNELAHMAPDGIALIEDCSHAHFCSVESNKRAIPLGTLGQAAVWSFYPTKVLFGSEFGLVTVRDPGQRNFARHIANQGKDSDAVYRVPGYNYRASELSACLAAAVIETRSKFIGDRISWMNAYDDAGVSIIQKTPGLNSTGYKFTSMAFESRLAKTRLRSRLHAIGAKLTGSTYTDLCGEIPQAPGPRTRCLYPGASRFAERHINLPYEPFASKERREYVAEAVGTLLSERF